MRAKDQTSIRYSKILNHSLCTHICAFIEEGDAGFPELELKNTTCHSNGSTQFSQISKTIKDSWNCNEKVETLKAASNHSRSTNCIIKD